jgi:hypothetical protein
MPTYTITNLTNCILPVHSCIGSIPAHGYVIKELDVYKAERVESRLSAMTEAGLISWTVALPADADDVAGKISFAPASLKGNLLKSGTGTPNGYTYGTVGDAYVNLSGGAAAVAMTGDITVTGMTVPTDLVCNTDYFTIKDGVPGSAISYVFTFVDTAHPLVDTTRHPVSIQGLTTDVQLATAIKNSINATTIRVTASNTGPVSVVSLVHDDLGVFATAAVTENVTDADFVVHDFSGDTNSTLWIKESGANTRFGWIGK